MFGLNFIIFRPHNVYGPQQNIADKYRNVIGALAELVRSSPVLWLLRHPGRHALTFTG
jgi:UDP-glucose 4-epimerase